MERITGKKVRLNDEALLQKEHMNRAYLMELQSPALLQNYYLEAGIGQNFGQKTLAHRGWEDPSCQLRGHFLGHYLSACAVRYYSTGDTELLAKANAIVDELAVCQKENGGTWVASIPEKYFHWIRRGKSVWAPHYTVHKTFLGLLDMYRYGGNEKALQIADRFAEWFYDFTGDMSREELNDLLDFETGGMLEIWAELYEFTRKDMYLELIGRYDRHRLFDPLLEGVDVLTNMHANTTIPEAIGAARVYEVTGMERYRDIALKYWELAVDKRGTFVTGGQTCGEIWTPPHKMDTRLGNKNQEHCTVYNMMRLADILFTWTGDHKYADYIEKNLYNGVMAQCYYKGSHTNGQIEEYPDEGLITYFLPLMGGARKGWGTKFDDFFCCHGSLVQANASHNRYLYYTDEQLNVYTGVYAASELKLEKDGKEIVIKQARDTLSGSFHSGSTSSAGQAVAENTHIYQTQPDVMKQVFEVRASGSFTLYLRQPGWLRRAAEIYADGIPAEDLDASHEGFLGVKIPGGKDVLIELILPMDLTAEKLQGSDDMIAYTYGPYALAGLTRDERILYAKGRKPEELLVHDNEREWGSWKDTFKTRYQDPAIRFVPINQIGYETYQVYFSVE